jgi:stearoyl-CoA 9-desaturase NADPH oxidoreductase
VSAVAEQGARPRVSKLRRRILDAARAFTNPLLPDDYLELINPLWSTRELRGRVERIQRESGNAATLEVRPGHRWSGHKPGQYVRVGFDVDGVRHWRAYSLTSEPDRPDGFISITPKLVEEGKVTPFIHRELHPGALVFLSDVEGQFVLPDQLPQKLLFISAGSGITPIMSMLRSLDRQDAMGDVAHLHSSRTPGEVIFGAELRALAARHDGFDLHEQHTGEHGRIGPDDLDRLCPDWRERETFASGPGEMLDALADHWERHAHAERFHLERFQPRIGGSDAAGEGGTITFVKSGCQTHADGGTPILAAGEAAGLELAFGCRMGICHTCVGRFRSGRVRDLRSGEVMDAEGLVCRICVNAPEGPVEVEL